MRALRRRRDPAPSKTAFRARRLWRSRAVRRLVTLWLPVALTLGGGVWAAGQADLRAAAEARVAAAYAALTARPEFAVRRLVVTGAEPALEAELRRRLAGALGASSITLDAAELRAAAEASGWVAAASVRLEAPETLRVAVRARTPALVWRLDETLTLLDRHGDRIDRIETRAARADLPLVAGRGAATPRAAAEALRLFEVAGHLAPRIRGLVRVGERRWDVVLQDGPVIMLPGKGAVDALAYLVALDAGEGVVARDLVAVDLRLRSRPTLRLGPDAVEALEGARRRLAAEEDA